jgi:hypothetical protein
MHAAELEAHIASTLAQAIFEHAAKISRNLPHRNCSKVPYTGKQHGEENAEIMPCRLILRPWQLN